MLLRKAPGEEIVNIPVWWEMKVAKPFPFPGVTAKPWLDLLTHPHQRISFRWALGFHRNNCLEQ